MTHNMKTNVQSLSGIVGSLNKIGDLIKSKQKKMVVIDSK